MANKKEVTAPVVSDSADMEQPPNVNNNSISNNPPLIDGLLYTGIYLFAGAPKLGKSFLMAQIAYHISREDSFMGLPCPQSGGVVSCP